MGVRREVKRLMAEIRNFSKAKPGQWYMVQVRDFDLESELVVYADWSWCYPNGIFVDHDKAIRMCKRETDKDVNIWVRQHGHYTRLIYRVLEIDVKVVHEPGYRQQLSLLGVVDAPMILDYEVLMMRPLSPCLFYVAQEFETNPVSLNPRPNEWRHLASSFDLDEVREYANWRYAQS